MYVVTTSSSTARKKQTFNWFCPLLNDSFDILPILFQSNMHAKLLHILETIKRRQCHKIDKHILGEYTEKKFPWAVLMYQWMEFCYINTTITSDDRESAHHVDDLKHYMFIQELRLLLCLWHEASSWEARNKWN